jgi:uncharacterized protein (TIGR01777 family)
MDRILITGASGPIGRALVPSFASQGIRVVRLVRGIPKSADEVSWDPMAPVPPEIVSGFDAIIHLAGESVMGRWTDEKKKAIRGSRVKGTSNLVLAMTKAKAGPRLFISASAVGFYGDRGDELLTEESPGGSGFAAELARAWEAASRIPTDIDINIRPVNLRIGLVLSPEGGALAKMLTPFKLGLGGRLGPGTQWWSWVHVADIVGAVHHVVRTESIAGPVNMVAPNPLRNSEFTRVLASVLGRPALFPVPAFAMRLALGEMAQELMLTSQRVVPRKLESSGYTFRFNELRAALDNLLG